MWWLLGILALLWEFEVQPNQLNKLHQVCIKPSSPSLGGKQTCIGPCRRNTIICTFQMISNLVIKFLQIHLGIKLLQKKKIDHYQAQAKSPKTSKTSYWLGSCGKAAKGPLVGICTPSTPYVIFGNNCTLGWCQIW